MKNFLELLATDQKLSVVVDNKCWQSALDQQLEFDIHSVVTVDGIEILPRYSYLAVDSKLTITEPFYQWYHRVSGQGWLLTPR